MINISGNPNIFVHRLAEVPFTIESTACVVPQDGQGIPVACEQADIRDRIVHLQ